MVGSGGDTMSFDIPTPFDDWEEPAYAFVNINGARLFLAQDENAAVWADATDAEAEEMTDQPDEASVAEFAGEEGLSEDEALAEIEEISEDQAEEMMDVEEDGGENA